MKSQVYAPVVLRLGIGFVFLWFGFSQLHDQDMWLSLIPDSLIALTGISAKAMVIGNGIFEIVFATLMVCGIWVRYAALLLALHLIGIIGAVGLNAIGIRDVGLMLATFAIALHGCDQYSFGNPS